MHAAELRRQQALVVRLLALVAALVLALPAVASAQEVKGVSDLTTPPAGFQQVPQQVLDRANALPAIKEERAKYKGSYPGVYTKGTDRWQVSYFSRDKPPKEIAQVTLWDYDGRVLEAYTGYKVAWTMARGYDGAFGRKVNSPWVWVPLTILFVLPFLQLRKPLRWLHLDVLVLAAFGLSLWAFNEANIDLSTPLVFPLLGYLLLRMLCVTLFSRPESERAEHRRPLPLLLPTTWLVIALLFLVGFRIGLNITSSNVIDVGYAGVIGAQKLVDGDPLYGGWPKDNEHGDTYGPVAYALYIPFEQVLPWTSGTWDDLPAAHAAALAFDLLVILLLFLVGRRVRGPGLGIVLAYAWAAYPFTIYVSNSNANDALVPLFLLVALLAAEHPLRRGAVVALGGLTKFASLAVAPVFAMHRSQATGRTAFVRFCLGFGLAAAIAFLPVWLAGNSPADVWERTIAYQADRKAPFSIWGLYGLDTLQQLWQGLAVALAVGLAFVPRRRDLVGLAAAAAAVVLAVQMSLQYWFYLYLVWCFPLVLIALLGRYEEPRRG